MTKPYLLLWLEAPLQAWGHDSRFGRRDSLNFPTKSALLGLLCCARGAAGSQSDWLGNWASLDMQVIAYARQQGQSSVRQAMLCDFHMVGSGYDRDDRWQNLMIPKTAEGKPAVGGGTKLTYRYYLQDMAYAVLLQAPDAAQAGSVAQALQQPVWDIYLGRKHCVPSEWVYQGTFAASTDALEAASQLAQQKERAAVFQVLQGEHDGERLSLNDVPLQFGQHKRYRDRLVTVQTLEHSP
ncbi:type I-E CRISPR-associated protein Cas5/CasD [Neisseriaceae bacterium TC5R-5]|nr:type I-E CRISPR-associated protein Cas5/CasD [Neisseriaceae bacterium TC5R-5]